MESNGGNLELIEEITNVMFTGNKTTNFQLTEFPNFVKVTLVEGEEACDNCHGSPFRFVFNDLIEIIDDCEYCKGTGYKIDVCLKCSGTGIIEKKVSPMVVSEYNSANTLEVLVHQIEKIQCPTCKGTGEYVYRPNFPKHPKGLPCPHCTPKDENGRYIKDEDRKIPKGKVFRVVPRHSNQSEVFCCSICGGTGKKKKKRNVVAKGEGKKPNRKTVLDEHVQTMSIAMTDAQNNVASAAS